MQTNESNKKQKTEKDFDESIKSEFDEAIKTEQGITYESDDFRWGKISGEIAAIRWLMNDDRDTADEWFPDGDS